MRDGRNRGLVQFSEAILEKYKAGKIHLPAKVVEQARDAIAKKRAERARPAGELLADLGLPECPPDTPPSAGLFRECRHALGISQASLSWLLGSSSKAAPKIVADIESGRRRATRAQRLLLRGEIRRLDIRQKDRSFT